MRLFNADLTQDVAIVAEIGNNHEGSFSCAEELIGRAAEAGAHAVKFQTFVPEHYVSRQDKDRLTRLRKFAFSQEQFEKLAKVAEKSGVGFFSTAFDLESAEALNGICPVFKISSGDNTFFPLIEAVAAFKKPILLSTGLAQLSDLERARDTITSTWNKSGYSGQIVFLHCVSSYPTPVGEANLGAIRSLADHFGGFVGYSDHTLGIEAATLSVALGARVIEKHFTLDKNYSTFRDHQLSSDPAELAELVDRVRRANEMMGDGNKSLQHCEEGNRVAMRRSIAAAVNLSAGMKLSPQHLTWVRPGTGVPPGEESLFLNRTLKRDVAQGEILGLADVA